MVICHVDGCPFKAESGFCKNRMVIINEGGGCCHVFIKPTIVNEKWREPVEDFRKTWSNAETPGSPQLLEDDGDLEYEGLDTDFV